MKLRSFACAVCVLFGLLFAARPAFAARCDQLMKLDASGVPTTTPAPPVVTIAGSSPLKTMYATFAPALFNDPTLPITIVYRVTPSCTAVNNILSGLPMASNDTTEAIYWDPNSKTAANGTTTANEEKCTLPNGTLATIGTADVFAPSCGVAMQGLPNGFADFQGPIQIPTFAVNRNSKEQVISAEAAYMLFGHAKIAPWTDPKFIFRRNAASGTQLLIGAAIGVDAKRWAGVDSGSSDNVFASLAGLTNQADQDKSIGILLSDFASKPELRILAYQHYGQRCGYKPDATALDKKHVREGRYTIWGPLHMFTQVDGSGLAKDQRARDLIAYMIGTKAAPGGLQLLRTQVQIGNVPECAMKVKRSSEMGPLSPFKHPQPCGCAFDKEATGTSTCKACQNNNECSSSQSCNFGFCEEQ